MKRSLFALSLCAAALTFSVVGCKKDKEVDCTSAAQKLQDKSTAFASDPSTDNCKALKAAYKDYLTSSCISASDKEVAQQALEALDMFCE